VFRRGGRLLPWDATTHREISFEREGCLDNDQSRQYGTIPIQQDLISDKYLWPVASESGSDLVSAVEFVGSSCHIMAMTSPVWTL
jgi:hypothetical protein